MIKKLILSLLFFPCLTTFAQISEGGNPFSMIHSQLKSQISIPLLQLKALNQKSLIAEDSVFPTPYRYSIYSETTLNIKNGLTTNLSKEKGKIWQFKVSAENAVSIQLVFTTFQIPPQAKLFVYNDDYSVIFGAFTDQNNEADSSFNIADFPGNSLILEYFEPDSATFEGKLIIGSIGQAYRSMAGQESGSTDVNGYIDVNCDEGSDWQTEKHAVCKITFREGSSGYVCSGALLNNTRNDGTPYFLTASHCISDSTVAKTLIAYFNYENTTCNGLMGKYRTLSGSRLMTTGSKSDYTLLKLNTTPPASYMPFYAGWDINNSLGDNNVCIHHPEGLAKKISLDYDGAKTNESAISWDQGSTSPVSSHWQVSFDAGVTGEGSSGSPLFNKFKRVVGQLHGGDTIYEYYGKFSYSWNDVPTKYKRLYKYLDPDSTGVKVLDGYAPKTNPPDAYFKVEFGKACLTSPVHLYQTSAFKPTSQTWTITPATFTFLEGTSGTSSDPVVEFTAGGGYTIKLKAKNANGQDSMQISNAITAGTAIQAELLTKPGTEVCYCNLDSIVFNASGASSYTWSIIPQKLDPFYFTSIRNSSAVIVRNPAIAIDSTYNLQVKLVGYQGQCSDTLLETVKIIKQYNDDIENAIPLNLGFSPTYSNQCATVQANEPVPPAGSCTGQASWCDEYNDGTRLAEHSVWFTFLGPESGYAGIHCTGFDSEIAVYKAESATDLFKGIYTLIAANDDESTTNPNSLIPKIQVIPGAKYWIQVDGSGGGSQGSFIFKLTDNDILGVETLSGSSIKLYPQPARDLLNLSGDQLISKSLRYSIFDLTGKLIVEKTCENFGDTILSLDVSYLSRGMYILKVETGSSLITQKFIKE